MAVNKKSKKIILEAFLPYQITVLADLVARRTAAASKTHGGLNLSQWRVLAAVATDPGRTANDVVAVTPMDKGIVSRAVKGLLDMRFLVRNASQQDGRIGHLYMTRKGEQVYEAIASEVQKVEEELLSALAKSDQKKAGAIFAKMISTLME